MLPATAIIFVPFAELDAIETGYRQVNEALARRVQAPHAIDRRRRRGALPTGSLR